MKTVELGQILYWVTIISEPYAIYTPKQNGGTQKRWMVDFRCKCGAERSTRLCSVTSGTTKSCGCYSAFLMHEKQKQNPKYTVSTKHPLYGSWASMRNRCRNSNLEYYFGGKIQVCEEWVDNYQTFYEWAILQWKDGDCLQRKDLDKNFFPENCYFKSQKEISAETGRKYAYKRVGLKRRPESIEKMRQTSMERYGTSWPTKSKIIKDKIVATNRKKYGTDYPQQFVQKRYDGKTVKELAEEKSLSVTHMHKRIRIHGYDKAMSMEKLPSNLEVIMKSYLDKIGEKYQEQFRVQSRIADFFLPKHNLIIETDGLYWHGDLIIEDKKYHRNKKNLYTQEGFDSLFFREDEIINKFDIVQSIINNKIGTSTRIFARKCEIVTLSMDERREFFEANHLMGKGRGKCWALKYNDEIVTAIQITYKKDVADISRFCHKLNHSVVGGFSKLLKQVEKDLSPEAISTFIDQRYGKGHYLKDLGFELMTNHISFKWSKRSFSVHRMKFPGNSGYDAGYFKLWDCGQAKYVKRVRTAS